MAKRAYTVATRYFAPLSQLISRRRNGWAPRGVADTLDEVLAAREGEVCVAIGEQRTSRRLPRGEPKDHVTFRTEADEIIPRAAVAELPRGRVLGPYRAVLTGRGTLVGELSPYFGITRALEHPVFLHPLASPPTRIEGRLAVLAARGDVSYYHYLLDVLPRLEILARCPTIAPPDRLYIPAVLSFQRELLAMMSIPEESIVDSDQFPHVQADSLVVPSLPDADLKTPPWVVAFLRERLLPTRAQRVPGRRIYVTRGSERGNRIVTNEAEVAAMLTTLGFAVVDPGTLSVARQIETFAEAEWIVAPHGAALANLAFASPGATVIELFAPDYVQGCYWKLSDCVTGLDYRYLVGSGKQPRAGRMWGVDSDITVDSGALARMLRDLPAS